MPCPSAQELDAFASAGLPAACRTDLEEHFAGCASCSGLVAVLIATELAEPESPTGPDDRSPPDDALEGACPRYRLIQLLGAGGMGVVYEAEELRSGRRVALKLAQEPGGARGVDLVQRFSREARIAALLEHPNIVPVFDLGVFPDGVAYYTQRLVQGRNLGAAIASCRTPRERIALMVHFRDLCDAVAYAHGRGVVHRDLKPSNALVGASGETWVIDWGLARATAIAATEAVKGDFPTAATGDSRISDPALTVAGTTVGTPAYMSPEQARGQIELVDERSDVWALGAILSELLTGQPPFAGLEVPEILRRLCEGQDRRLPAGLASKVPGELVAIAAKAQSARRELRYDSAVELAADVNAWMVGARVSAYSYSPFERARRWVKRHRVLSAALAVLLVLGAGWSFSLRAVNRRLAHDRSEDLLVRAKRAARVLQWDRAAVYFAGALALEERVDARLALAAVGLASARPLWKQPARCSAIRGLAFSDRTTLVAAGENGAAVAFDLDTGSEVGRQQLGRPATAMATCDGGLVAISAGPGAALWRPREAQLALLLAHPSTVEGVALSEDCGLLATASADGVRLFNLPGGELAARFGAGEAAVDVAFLKGRRLLWASARGLHESGVALNLPLRHAIRSLSAARGTHRVLARLADGSLASFDLSTPGTPRVLPSAHVHELATDFRAGTLSPGGREIVAFGSKNVTWLFDADTGVPYTSLAGFSRPIRAGAVSGDGRYMASGGDDGFLRVYDLIDARRAAGHAAPGGEAALAIAWSPNAALLASGGRDGSVRLWDAETGVPRASWGNHLGAARAVQFSADGSKLASAGADGVRFWDVETGKQLGDAGGLSARRLVWIAADAVAIAGDDGALAVRKLDGSGTILHREHRGPVSNLACSPDGARVASSGIDGALVLYDLRAGSVVHKVSAHEKVLALAWSKDGRRLATAGLDRGVSIWDAASLKLIEQKTGYGTADVASLDFALASGPVPGVLLVGNELGEVAFLEERSARTMFAFTAWGASLTAAYFSPDGRRIAVLAPEGAVRLFPLEAARERGALERLMRHYKYEADHDDLVRDEVAMTPPALRAGGAR